MKKFSLCFVAILFALFCLPFAKTSAHAATLEESSDAREFFAQNYFQMIYDDENHLRFYDRTAGTEGEKEFAKYLETQMLEFGYMPNGSDEQNKSFEYFSFESSVDGLLHKSQNVKFIKKNENTLKKVIICTYYDNVYGYSPDAGLDAIGNDAGLANVLSVLFLANELKDVDLDFSVEFVFFGAGCNGLSGSKFFALGLGEDDRENILLALCIDDLSCGSFYYYDDEVSTKHGNFAQQTFEKGGLDVQKYKAGSSLIFSSGDNYPFSHRALWGDNVSFLESGVRTLSILTANKSGYFNDEFLSIVQNGKFDGLVYPSHFDRVATLSVELAHLIESKDFAQNMTGNTTLAKFWTDKRIGIFATIIGLVAVFVVYEIVYQKQLKTMKQKFSAIGASKIVGDKVDEEINKSNDPKLLQNRSEIKNMFEEDIKRKMGDDQQGDDKN